MLMVSRWQTAAILGVTAFFCLAAVPNVLPARAFVALPAWAQRTVPLGYDLQGGTYLQLEVDAQDVRKQLAERLRDDVRKVLRDARIGYTGLVGRPDGVDVRVRESSDVLRAQSALKALVDPVIDVAPARERRTVVAPGQASVSAYGSPQPRPALVEMSVDGPQFRLTLTKAAIDERIEQAHKQATDILERRMNALGMSANIRAVGRDRIVVEMPGIWGPGSLIHPIR